MIGGADRERDMFAVVEFWFDPSAENGWSSRVEAAPWMRTGAVGRLLREVADRFDPPHPLLDLTAEHHPDCTCPRCVKEPE